MAAYREAEARSAPDVAQALAALTRDARHIQLAGLNAHEVGGLGAQFREVPLQVLAQSFNRDQGARVQN